VWQDYNPHPEWDTIPPQLVFVSPTSADGKSGFNEQDPVTSGLQELAFIFAGELEPAQGTDVTFTPLVSTGPGSGNHAWSEMVQESFFGIIPQLEGLRYEAKGEARVLAARVAGKMRAPVDGATMKRGELSQKPFEAIVVADMDLVSDVFFALRRQGSADFSLDNVSFVANCIDSLAGEDAYLELRKRRPRHRTLTRFEEIDREQNEVQRQAAKVARDRADAKLKEAQERLSKKVEAIEARTDLDYRTKQIMLETMRQREQRKLQLAERQIKDEESDAVRQGKRDANLRVHGEKMLIIGVGGVLCAWPVLALGLFVLGRKMQRERAGIDPARRRAS